MRGSAKERREVREAFRKMTFGEKVSYICTYYKLPLFTAAVALIVLITTLVGNAVKKQPVLYAGWENVSFGEMLDHKLTDGYITFTQRAPKKYTVLVYRDLYISDEPSGENHQYAYASKIKVLGAISAKQMDLVVMNGEAYRQMSESGFLLDLSAYVELQPYLVSNQVIVEDNAVEYSLGESETYSSVTETAANAVDASGFPIFRNAGITENLYIAIIANSPRQEECLNYILYLLDAEQ